MGFGGVGFGGVGCFGERSVLGVETGGPFWGFVFFCF